MKKNFLLTALILSLISCNPNRTSILEKGYIGMSPEEYKKVFADNEKLSTVESKINGKLNPRFTGGQLSSLELSTDNIDDYLSAYNVYELGNDLCRKYGTPVVNRETIWAGGTSRYYKWKKESLQVEYRFYYDQVQGTGGFLYSGNAKMIFAKADSNDANP